MLHRLFPPLLGLALWSCACAQAPPAPVRLYTGAADSLCLDSLRRAWPRAVLPEGFELPALRALSHYPELQGVDIRFRFERNKTAHTSRPRLWGVLRRPAKRCYLIAISTRVPEFFTPGMLRNLPYNAQIGVLGHELAHTRQYLDLRLGALLREGIRYQTRAGHVQATEHLTDSIAIQHHLGYQLLAWSTHVRHLLREAGRDQNYLSPAEISAYLRRLPAYTSGPNE
jgi:hypothetical protein